MTSAALGMRAFKGGAVVVGVALKKGAPFVVVSSLLATAVGGDRLALEPYHVAADMVRNADGGGAAEAADVVAEGRRRQERTAADGLRALVGGLVDAGYKPVVAALLVNRAGWITDLLEYSMAWREHVPVAELLAVRDALRFAIKECNLQITGLALEALRG